MKKKYWLWAFLLSLLLGAIIVIPNIILGGKGIYTLFADLNFQQIPFNKMINEAIKSGNILWNWQNELGSNFIGTFSFYNLFSPFNIIGYLFPAKFFPYLIGPIFILKYAVAGLTSYLFLKRYVKNPKYAIIGSLLYSFSGFQLTNIIFYHFHDIVAFFPLLLYTLDNLIYDNKKGGFALVLALCAITNWFFFIGQVVFLVLYFLVKVITKEYKMNKKKFIQLIIEGLIGCGIAAFVLIPSLLFTMGNPRVNSSWTLSSMLKHGGTTYLEILRALIMPPEIMSYRSIITPSNFTSIELYLPFVGCVLAFSYLIKNYKKWDSILLLILFVFMLYPILNSTFFAFTTNYYARWFYMPILLLSLVSIKTLEEKIKIKKGIIATIIIGGLFIILSIHWFKHSGAKIFIYDKPYFMASIILTIISIIALMLVSLIKKENKKITIIIILIFISVAYWGNYLTYTYKLKTFKTEDSYYNYVTGKDNYNVDKNVRTNSVGCYYNSSYLYDVKNLYNWNSNLNSTDFEFYYSLDYPRVIQTEISVEDKSLNDFLAVQYIFDCSKINIENYGYKLSKKENTYDLYENKDAKPVGFILNSYMSLSEFKNLITMEKPKVLNEKIILNNEQIKKYKNLFEKDTNYTSTDFKYLKNSYLL